MQCFHAIRNSGKHFLAWKNGNYISPNGYLLVRCVGHPMAKHRGHYVLKHRLVMEKHLGRYLKKKEVVHHKNGNKMDNRLRNLELMTQSQHMKHHCEERRKTRIVIPCDICGKPQRCIRLCANHYALMRHRIYKARRDTHARVGSLLSLPAPANSLEF